MASIYNIVIQKNTLGYTVEVHGPHNFLGSHPFTWLASEKQKQVLERLKDEEATVSYQEIEELGKVLYEAIIDPVLEKQIWGRERLFHPVRIQLKIEAPDLMDLPWELLHDREGFLTTRNDVTLVQKIDRPKGDPKISNLRVREPLKILFVAASPFGLPLINFQGSYDDIKACLNLKGKKKAIVFDHWFNASSQSLRYKLKENYHIIFFLGHGDSQHIYLDDGEGKKDTKTGEQVQVGGIDKINANEFAELLKGKGQTRLVFMASCETYGGITNLDGSLSRFGYDLTKRAGLPAVVAMRYKVDNINTRNLVAQFFASLSRFDPIDVALAEARKSLESEKDEHPESGKAFAAPVLILQSDDAQIFQRGINWPILSGLITALLGILIALYAILLAPSQQVAQERVARQAAEATSNAQATLRAESEATAVAEAKISRSNDLALSSTRAISEATLGPGYWPQRSLLFAIEAVKKTLAIGFVTHPAEQSLRRTLNYSMFGIALANLDNGVSSVAISPDNHWAISTGSYTPSTGYGNSIFVYNLEEPNKSIIFKTKLDNNVNIADSTFSSDGNWLLINVYVGGTVPGFYLFNVKDNDPKNWLIILKQLGNIKKSKIDRNSKWLCGIGENQLLLWNLHDITEPIKLSQNQPITDYSFNPNGDLLVAGTKDGSILLWKLINTQDETDPTFLTNEGNEITSISFGNDGNKLAVATNRTIKLWNFEETGLKQPSTIYEIDQDGQDITDVSFSPKGTWLIFNFNSNIEVIKIDDPSHQPKNIYGGMGVNYKVSPDENWLATTTSGGNMVWESKFPLINLNDPSLTSKYDLYGHEGIVSAFNFSADSKYLITGGNISDQSVRLWDLEEIPSPCSDPRYKQRETNHFVREGDHFEKCGAEQPLSVEIEGRYSLPIFTQDMHWMIVRSNNFFDLWNTKTDDINKRATISLGNGSLITAISKSSDDHWLVTGGQDGKLKIWDLNSISIKKEPEVINYHNGPIQDIMISKNSRWLISTSRDSTAVLWDFQKMPLGKPFRILGFDSHKSSISFNPNSDSFVMSNGTEVDLYTNLTEQSDSLVNVKKVRGEVHYCADGSIYLFTSTKNINGSTVKMSKLDSNGNLYTELDIPDNFSKDPHSYLNLSCEFLIISTDDGDFSMWDIRNLTQKDILSAPKKFTRPSWSVPLVSPDNHWLITYDVHTLQISDISDPETSIANTSFDRYIYDVKISDDNRWLGIISDAETKLYDLSNPALGPLKLGNSGGSFMSFSPDSQWITIAPQAEIPPDITSIPLNIDELLKLSCSVAGRNFSTDEWKQFFAGEQYHKTCDQWP